MSNNLVFDLIKNLIKAYGVKFIVNCSESIYTIKDNAIIFRCFVNSMCPKITPETEITFDKENNEFVWFDEEEEPEFEFRAKPFIELTRDFASAFSELMLNVPDEDCLPTQQMHELSNMSLTQLVEHQST